MRDVVKGCLSMEKVRILKDIKETMKGHMEGCPLESMQDWISNQWKAFMMEGLEDSPSYLLGCVTGMLGCITLQMAPTMGGIVKDLLAARTDKQDSETVTQEDIQFETLHVLRHFLYETTMLYENVVFFEELKVGLQEPKFSGVKIVEEGDFLMCEGVSGMLKGLKFRLPKEKFKDESLAC